MRPVHARGPLLGATGLVAAAGWWGVGAAAHCPPLARLASIPLRVDGSAREVALTFDDGPHPAGTPGVLNALERTGSRATFFLVGEQVIRYRALVAELVAAGHEPAVHAYRHRNQMRLRAGTIADDLRRAVDVIGEASGRPPRLYRPPYGAFTTGGLAIVRRASLEPVLWSKWGRDWRGDVTPEEIVARVTAGLSAGDVVLLHDADWYSSPGSHRRTVRALPELIAAIHARGLVAAAL